MQSVRRATVVSLSWPLVKMFPFECTAVSTNGDTKHASKMTLITTPIHPLRRIVRTLSPKLPSLKLLQSEGVARSLELEDAGRSSVSKPHNANVREESIAPCQLRPGFQGNSSISRADNYNFALLSDTALVMKRIT